MLSGGQLCAFADDGYIVLRDVVDEALLAAADEEVDALVASAPPAADTCGTHFYFEPAAALPAADEALRGSDALLTAESLVAPCRLEHGYGHIQVALNIPPFGHRPGGPHLDGYHQPDPPHPFTMLAAIFLSDESSVDSGNLWVWPSSHLAHRRLFQQHGVRALVATGGHATLLQPPIDVGRPVPVLARRGDLLLAHYLLGHNSGGNLTGQTRRILYYRLSTIGHARRALATLTDPFVEYRPVVEAAFGDGRPAR